MAKLFRAVKNDLYEVDIKDVDGSVAVMDRFEGKLDPHIKYKLMLLKRAFQLELNCEKYLVDLYISREKPDYYPASESKYLPNITFTKLREIAKEKLVLTGTNPDQVSEYSAFFPILKTIKHFSKQHCIEVDKVLTMQSSLLFCAQNSDNLRGYGDEWRFGVCLSEGTKYGETTDYYVTKIKIARV